ncbi:thymidine kinase [Patescibacteria group bacterium]|nr:thymidine kinase [Patescibacteria group bacterium]
MTIEASVGSMFSGKTLDMLCRVISKEKGGLEWGVDYIIFNHGSDTRYGVNVIAAHANEGKIQAPAVAVNDSFELLNHICDWVDDGWCLKEGFKGLRDLFIDEAQFFDDDLVQVVDYIDRVLGVDVMVAGLDTDFRGEPFPGPIPGLLAVADKVIKHKAGCQCVGKCGNGATRTQRIVDGVSAGYHDEIFFVGAEEAYEARSKGHHEFRQDDPKPVPFTDRFSK